MMNIINSLAGLVDPLFESSFLIRVICASNLDTYGPYRSYPLQDAASFDQSTFDYRDALYVCDLYSDISDIRRNSGSLYQHSYLVTVI